MIKKIIYLFLFLSFAVHGQQTINKLITKELTVQDYINVTSTTKSSKPCPPMTLVQRDAIATPATGSCVYNTTDLELNVYDGTAWQSAGGGGINNWETPKNYDVDNVVIESNKIYQCEIAHTSGVFATDLASGKWVEISSVDLANSVGILPIANGGTGSSTQNFVDLTTNQAVAGEKTFSNTVKADSIQTTGSSGVQIKNSAGTNVADFGPAGTTNASIVGGLNVGANLLATGTVTGSNLSGTNTGDLLGGGDNDTPATVSNLIAPNKQLTLTGTNQYRVNTGNANELDNANFEHSTITTGWTISNATPSSSTTRIEGAKSLSLALTGALSLSQSSTINASQKSGVQMVASIFVKSDDVSDLQLCSLKNGAEDKCTVTGGYVQGSGWRQLTVSFLGDSTSNGLKLKSTDTTGTVLVDQAYVGIGSPIVDFTPDMEYTAQVSSTGVVTNENTDWINGNCSVSGARITCSYISTLGLSSKMNCVATPMSAGVANDTMLGLLSGNTTTGFVFDAGNGTTARDFSVSCEKAGADYKTSKAYVASSSGYPSIVASKISFTTVANTDALIALDLIDSNDGSYSLSSNGVTIKRPGVYKITLKADYGANGEEVVQKLDINGVKTSGKTHYVDVNAAGSRSMFRDTFYKTLNIGDVVKFYANVSTNNRTHYNPEMVMDLVDPNPVIVGSFQGYNETPGVSRVETFSFSYGTTNATTACTASPCSYLDQIGNNVSSVTRSSQGIYAANFSKTFSKLKCAFSGDGSAGYVAQGLRMSCSNCSTMPFNTRTTQTNTINDVYGSMICQGIPQ